MITCRSRINLISLFSVIFFAASLGSFKGVVLCYGSDGHIHTEITFNGVDCGHFPGTTSEQDAPISLTNPYHTPHANHCISCVDIPLSTDYALKKFNNVINQRTASKLRTLFSMVPTVHINTPFTTSRPPLPDTLKRLSSSLILIQSTVLRL